MDENKWNSRKLVVVVVSLGLAFAAALYLPEDARAEFFSFMTWVIPMYIGGQSIVDAVARR